MSKYTKKKLDNWIKKTICTDCEHLRSQVWEEPDEYQSNAPETYLVYTCNKNHELELEKNKGKVCKYFTKSSQEILNYNKNIYDNFVEETFDEDGNKIEDFLWDQYNGDEVIGHR